MVGQVLRLKDCEMKKLNMVYLTEYSDKLDYYTPVFDYK